MAAQLSWKDRMVVGKKLCFLGVCLPLPARCPASRLGCFWPELGRGSWGHPSRNRLGEAATRNRHFGRQNRVLKWHPKHGRIVLNPVLASNVTLSFSQNQNASLKHLVGGAAFAFQHDWRVNPQPRRVADSGPRRDPLASSPHRAMGQAEREAPHVPPSEV